MVLQLLKRPGVSSAKACRSCGKVFNLDGSDEIWIKKAHNSKYYCGECKRKIFDGVSRKNEPLCLVCGDCCLEMNLLDIIIDEGLSGLFSELGDFGYWVINESGVEIVDPILGSTVTLPSYMVTDGTMELMSVWKPVPCGYWVKGLSITLNVVNHCSKLTENKRCSIYDSPKRPAICREFFCEEAKKNGENTRDS